MIGRETLGRFAVDREDRIATLQAGLLGRTTRDDFVDAQELGFLIDGDRDSNATEVSAVEIFVEVGVFFGREERRIFIFDR